MKLSKGPRALSTGPPPGLCPGSTGNVSEFTAQLDSQLNWRLLNLRPLPIAGFILSTCLGPLYSKNTQT